MPRFVLIYGVVLFGGLNIAIGVAIDANSLDPPVDHAAVFVATKLVLGACWGSMMWFFLPLAE